MRWTGLLTLAVLALASSRALADPSPPKAVGSHRCDNNYPQSAANTEVHGDTLVAFRIGADGVPTDLHVAESSGSDDLDKAAVECVSAWRYEPAQAGGKPVAVPWKSKVVWNVDIPFPHPGPGVAHECKSDVPDADEQKRATAPAQIDFVVQPDGSVTEPFVGLSSGSTTFDKAALQCVAGWRYLPAMQDAQPIAASWGARIALRDGVAVVSENVGKPHRCFRYPDKAYRTHVEGTTVLSFLIGTDGFTTQASVAQSSGSKELDDASIECSRHWKYRPATRDGWAVAMPWRAQITWRRGFPFVVELSSGG